MTYAAAGIGGPDGLKEQMRNGFDQMRAKLDQLPEELAIQIRLHLAHRDGVQALGMTDPELQSFMTNAFTVRAA